jgi:hypothetical protein
MTDTKLFEVILGKDLKVGDIIVHDFQRILLNLVYIFLWCVSHYIMMKNLNFGRIKNVL